MAVTWGMLLKWLVFFCVVGLVFTFIYMGMRSLGITRGRFSKAAGVSFILAGISRFVYAQAQRIGMDRLWFAE